MLRVGFLAVLLTGCAHHMNAPGPSREALLLQLEQQMFDALKTRDAEALGRLLAPDFELKTPGEPAVDSQAFIAAVGAIPGTILEVGSDDTQARVMGEVGILTGHQRAVVRLDDGSVVTQLGAFTDVARWEKDRWVLVHAYNVNVSETVQRQ